MSETLLQEFADARRLTVMARPAPGCSACEYRRLHTPVELAAFHPLAGHGYQKEQGWSSEAAREAGAK
jgi:hypothetical protein